MPTPSSTTISRSRPSDRHPRSGHFAEACRLLDAALSADREPSLDRVQALTARANLLLGTDSVPADAFARYTEAIALASASDEFDYRVSHGLAAAVRRQCDNFGLSAGHLARFTAVTCAMQAVDSLDPADRAAAEATGAALQWSEMVGLLSIEAVVEPIGGRLAP
jgi:hypothetical protein